MKVYVAYLAKRGGCWFVRDALKIHLGVENDFRAARKAHPALLVEDLPALKAMIKAAGYSFNAWSHSRLDPLNGMRCCGGEKEGADAVIPKVPGTFLPCWFWDQS
jgi:hypothetical protein